MLIVEDESNLRDSLHCLMTSADYNCQSFASGEAFLARALPRPPRCLLLDLQLEGMNGLEVQNELNAQQAHLPTLFLSGDDNIPNAVSAMKGGAMDFLEKPFDPELLLDYIEHALQTSANDFERRQSTGQEN